MGSWSLWGIAIKKASDIARREPHQHGPLTSSESSLNLARQDCVGFEGQTQNIATLGPARNPNNISNGRQGPTLLLLTFFSTLLILQWKLWPNYNAELKESFHGNSRSLGSTFINETTFILNQLRANGTIPCHNLRTNFTLFSNLRLEHHDRSITPLSLPTNTLHTVVMDSYTADGTMRCSGGDYYETILYNNQWRSRPRVQDFGNGSYGISFFVDSMFEGLFNFSASLLFGNFHGLDYITDSWAVQTQVAFFQVEFSDVKMDFKSHHDHRDSPPTIVGEAPGQFRMCSMDDNNFQRREWDGRWTREWVNNSCTPNEQGRFLDCVPKEHESCNNFGFVGRGRCSGGVSRLESNGWVYSQALCGFHIYEVQEAWDCLSGHWLLFWGDSNFQDTIRNLILFVLNIPVPYWSTLSTFQLPRNFEEYFVNPERPDQAVHVSLIFNGHFLVWDGNLGLDSLQDSAYREYIARHFTGNSTSPDVVIMNSGLHDGKHFDSVASYASGVDRAVDFWKGLLDSLPPSKRIQVVYRTTVAPAGESRGMQSNPHKMEVFNKIMVERLLSSIPSTRIVDAFDMTFPFHFNNDYSDGGHYGRAPKADLKPWNLWNLEFSLPEGKWASAEGRRASLTRLRLVLPRNYYSIVGNQKKDFCFRDPDRNFSREPEIVRSSQSALATYDLQSVAETRISAAVVASPFPVSKVN